MAKTETGEHSSTGHEADFLERLRGAFGKDTRVVFDAGSSDEPEGSAVVVDLRRQSALGRITTLEEAGVDIGASDPHEHVKLGGAVVVTQAQLDDGSAQRVPPCGDQTPVYRGIINGPLFDGLAIN